jgi:hypothetical protein
LASWRIAENCIFSAFFDGLADYQADPKPLVGRIAMSNRDREFVSAAQDILAMYAAERLATPLTWEEFGEMTDVEARERADEISALWTLYCRAEKMLRDLKFADCQPSK